MIVYDTRTRGKMNIIKAWCPSQLCGVGDGNVYTHTPISGKFKKGCAHYILYTSYTRPVA